MRITGTVIDGHGQNVGTGLEFDDAGVLTKVLGGGCGCSCGGGSQESKPADLEGAYIIPGLVDVHCHGGGGFSFPDTPTPEGIKTAIDTHRSRGTTALVASLVSMIDPLPVIEALVPWCESGELAGIHMEGPFVSPNKAGAQNPAAIREPNLEELKTWLEAARGHIVSMTIAPEGEKAVEAAQMLLDYGARPSWGHTVATGEETRRVLYATAEYARSINFEGVPQTATHLFNAMPSLHHRHPGPVRELVAAGKEGICSCEIVGDGVHVNPDLVADVVNYLGENCMLITDAMAGAGMADGAYELGGLAVTIDGGVAKLTGTDTIAGSTARLGDEVTLLASKGFLPIEKIAEATSYAPARALNLFARSGVTISFTPGQTASCVVLGKDFEVRGVIRNGHLVEV